MMEEGGGECTMEEGWIIIVASLWVGMMVGGEVEVAVAVAVAVVEAVVEGGVTYTTP
jgi:hypothetical protein